MKTNRYNVSDECIACSACVEVAGNNFEINDTNMAYLKKQPENSKEEAECQTAMEVCPVDAISHSAVENQNSISPVLANSNIKKTLDSFPELKDVLVNLSSKFKKMQNPALYNTLAQFASFKDAAKITGVSICEILHTINKHLGTEEKLLQKMPECIQSKMIEETITGVDITWEESPDRYIYNNDSMPDLIEKISRLNPQENLVAISVENPTELLKVARGLSFSFNIEKTREYRVSIFNPESVEETDWKKRKESFEILDVRMMTSDPFDIIIKKSYEINEDAGFILIQRFEPTPMINMLSEMGFEHLTDYKQEDEIWIYFHKKKSDKSDLSENSEKPDVVIQSATPVAYPVIMRLLQSEKISKSINIKELKVWEETEKHLAWIANGKADISFSALITSAKLINSDIKIPALFVWDNFVILTRGYKAKDFKDLIGKTIHTPLFEEAPPAKITKYLIKATGLNPDDFNFVYGQPFGRPEKIYADFVTGQADTVILREPEASYAIKIMKDRGEEISEISYNEIWNRYNEGFGSFPNAGIVLKGEFVRKYPELTATLLEELMEAIDWVNSNREASARLSFDMMRQPVDRVELFLDRVNFDYVDGDRLASKVKKYFDILAEQGIVEVKADNKFLNIFRL
ncbi:MAG: ferredoxin [Bacteroidales bacterium]|nr:ferredoxin [Bacteroidales bacterium]